MDKQCGNCGDYRSYSDEKGGMCVSDDRMEDVQPDTTPCEYWNDESCLKVSHEYDLSKFKGDVFYIICDYCFGHWMEEKGHALHRCPHCRKGRRLYNRDSYTKGKEKVRPEFLGRVSATNSENKRRK